MAVALCAQTPKTIDYATKKRPATEVSVNMFSPELASRVVADKVEDWAAGMVEVSFYAKAAPPTAWTCQRDS